MGLSIGVPQPNGMGQWVDACRAVSHYLAVASGCVSLISDHHGCISVG